MGGRSDADAFVYMAVGEGDGGPTVPSGQELAKLFEESAPANLSWTFATTQKTDHFKDFASGLHDAFMALFPAWGFDVELTEAARRNGAKGVDDWFSKKQDSLGTLFHPSWFDLGVVAFTLTPVSGWLTGTISSGRNITPSLSGESS